MKSYKLECGQLFSTVAVIAILSLVFAIILSFFFLGEIEGTLIVTMLAIGPYVYTVRCTIDTCLKSSGNLAKILLSFIIVAILYSVVISASSPKVDIRYGTIFSSYSMMDPIKVNIGLIIAWVLVHVFTFIQRHIKENNEYAEYFSIMPMAVYAVISGITGLVFGLVCKYLLHFLYLGSITAHIAFFVASAIAAGFIYTTFKHKLYCSAIIDVVINLALTLVIYAIITNFVVGVMLIVEGFLIGVVAIQIMLGILISNDK